ncbi:MAG: hypothetical protein HC853_00015 [Anaerolineae bacterium]|nr:hypothetical protein [Anaerolineae bacterium]
MGKVNLRQVLLFAIAAFLAIRIVLFERQGDLTVRLTLAVFLSLILVIIAIVPFRGTTFERFIIEMLGEIFGPKEYLHQTAEEVDEPRTNDKPATPAKPKKTKAKTPNYAGTGALTLERPNFGLLLALFMALITVSSALTYAARSSALPVTAMWP